MELGLYESVITAELERRLADLIGREADITAVDLADQTLVLTRHVAAALHTHLSAERDPAQRVQLANQLLALIASSESNVEDPLKQLRGIHQPSAPGATSRYAQRPKTPLNDAALLTNAPDEPSLAAELKAEIESADSIDLLCAFVMWRGLRLLETPLQRAREADIPIRVITTTYIGGTSARHLTDWCGTSVPRSASSTTLPARDCTRRHGCSAAIPGSTRHTWVLPTCRPARCLKASSGTCACQRRQRRPCSPSSKQPSTPTGMRQSSNRTTPRGTVIASTMPWRRRVAIGVAIESRSRSPAWRSDPSRTSRRSSTRSTSSAAFTIVTATWLSRPRALVRPSSRPSTTAGCVSMAGARACCSSPIDARFWSSRFGPIARFWQMAPSASCTSAARDLSVGSTSLPACSRSPRTASTTSQRMPSRSSSSTSSTMPRPAPIDASSTISTPAELLGLTATPERADGIDVRSFFEGRTAAELRLWDALGADLLCPFHYFVAADGTDLRTLAGPVAVTTRPNSTTSSRATTHALASCLRQLRDKVSDVGAMRALGFCVSVAHAEYMARIFNEAGIPARAVSGSTPRAERDQALTDLRARDVNILFAADLFNEGLDIPDTDTILLLRPTESATIFLQQLGRGLRRTRDKAVLTVLDFVGLPPQGVQVRPEAARHHRRHTRGHRETGPRRLPLPAVRMLHSDGPPSADADPREHPLPDRQPLATDRRRTATPLRGRPRRLPRRVGHRTERHPPSRKSFLDKAQARRRSPHGDRIRTRGGSAQTCARLCSCRRSRPSDGLCPTPRR